MNLGGGDTEKLKLLTYGDDDRDETLLILVKEFNMIAEDGDLFKEENIGLKEEKNSFTAAKKRNKLKVIKETFRNFRV